MAGPAPWWEHIPTPTPHHLNHPTSRCLRMQRISGAKAAHFLWPGDRLSHTDPLLAALILGSSAYPIRKRQLGPTTLVSPFFASWKLRRLAGFRSHRILSHGSLGLT